MTPMMVVKVGIFSAEIDHSRRDDGLVLAEDPQQKLWTELAQDEKDHAHGPGAQQHQTHGTADAGHVPAPPVLGRKGGAAGADAHDEDHHHKGDLIGQSHRRNDGIPQRAHHDVVHKLQHEVDGLLQSQWHAHLPDAPIEDGILKTKVR